MKDRGNDVEKARLIDVVDEMKKSSPPPASVVLEKQKRTEIVFWLGMLFLASVTMTVGNKYVMKEYPFANILTLLQNGCCVMMLLGGNRAGFIDFKEFKARQWKIFSVNAIFLTMQIVTSLQALPLVAIATVVAFRNMCTVVIAFVDYTFFGNKFTNSQIAGLCVTTIGMIIYAGQDINFNFWGYMWLLGNSFATVSNTFWNKVYITKFTRELKIQTSFGVSLIQQVETLPLVIVMAFARGEFSAAANSSEYYGDDASSESVDIFSLPFFVQFVLLITCVGGFLIGITYPKCFSLLSGTSVVVASTANKAASILIGMYVFGTILLPIQVFGLLICIGGSLYYAVESKRKK
eukprot:g1581.t1